MHRPLQRKPVVVFGKLVLLGARLALVGATWSTEIVATISKGGPLGGPGQSDLNLIGKVLPLLMESLLSKGGKNPITGP